MLNDDEAEATARAGFPEFEHNQWAGEDEIERFGASAVGARRSVGWKRIIATILIIGLVVPMIGGSVYMFVRAITGGDGSQSQHVPETPFVPGER